MRFQIKKDSYIISTKKILLFIILIIICVVAIGILISRENGYKNQVDGYKKKVEELKNELLEEKGKYKETTLDAWDKCLQELKIKADVVFLGDSITHRADFASYFPNLTVCNFGIGSDTIEGINQRVKMVNTVNPSKVFLLCGINSLRSKKITHTFDEYEQKQDGINVTEEEYNSIVSYLEEPNIGESFKEYEELVNNLRSETDATIYIISVLPVSKDVEKRVCSNQTITNFNDKIKKLCDGEKIIYVDLNTKMLCGGGVMNPDYTFDGVHLTKEGYDLWIDEIAKYVSVQNEK